jgi:hypothetical protein
MLPLLSLMLPLANATPPEPDPTMAFFEAGYGPCDAHLLSMAWGVEFLDAKTMAGRFLARGKKKPVVKGVDRGRSFAFAEQRLCSFYDVGLMYDDAVALAQIWSLPLEEAKAKMDDRVTRGRVLELRQALADNPWAHGAPDDGWEHYEEGPNEDLAAFFASGYTWCDVSVLAAAWQVDTYEAKLALGQKVRTSRELAESGLAWARQQTPNHRCPPVESGYDEVEIRRLATTWGVSAADATARLERELLAGTAPPIIGEGDEQDVGMAPDLEAFFASDYTLCDADVLAAAWGVGRAEAKASLGYKTRMGWNQLAAEALTDARGQTGGRVRCPYHENGFTFDDVTELAAAWRVSVPDAKLRIERALLEGRAATLRRGGQK